MGGLVSSVCLAAQKNTANIKDNIIFQNFRLSFILETSPVKPFYSTQPLLYLESIANNPVKIIEPNLKNKNSSFLIPLNNDESLHEAYEELRSQFSIELKDLELPEDRSAKVAFMNFSLCMESDDCVEEERAQVYERVKKTQKSAIAAAIKKESLAAENYRLSSKALYKLGEKEFSRMRTEMELKYILLTRLNSK